MNILKTTFFACLLLSGCVTYHYSDMSRSDFMEGLLEAGWTHVEAEEDWQYYVEHKSR